MSRLRLAPFRPSSAEQWVNCQGAARVNYVGSFIDDPPNPEAEEGTTAHEYLAALLTAPSEDAVEVTDAMKRLAKERFPTVSDEDAALLETVADDVYWIKETGGYELHVEREFPLTIAGSTHECTIDILLVNEATCIIIDLKWGKGQPVRVFENKQTTLYMHAVAPVYPGRTYQVGIYQPRGVGTGLDTWIIPDGYAMDSMVMFQAAGERAQDDRVSYTLGDHCIWCDGRKKGMCPEYQRLMIDTAVIGAGFSLHEKVRPPWWILDFDKHIRLCLEKVGKLADAELSVGREVPGWKWVAKKGNRRWVDPETAAESLAEKLGGVASDYLGKPKPPPVIGVTEASRRAKKKRVNLDDLMDRPEKFVRVKSADADDLGAKPIE